MEKIGLQQFLEKKNLISHGNAFAKQHQAGLFGQIFSGELLINFSLTFLENILKCLQVIKKICHFYVQKPKCQNHFKIYIPFCVGECEMHLQHLI